MNKTLRSFLVILLLCSLWPVSALKEYSSLQESLLNRKQLPSLDTYRISTEYFKVVVLTPSAGYRMAVKNKEDSIYSKSKKFDDEEFDVSKEDLSEIDFWDYTKPEVTVWLVPQPQTKNIAKAGRFLGYTTAGAFTVATLGIGMATLGLPGKIGGYKVSKDAARAKLITKHNDEVCIPLSTDHKLLVPLAQQYFFSDDHYERFTNKLYLTEFRFSPECFARVEKLNLSIENESNGNVLKLGLSSHLIKAIRRDFGIINET